MHILRRVADEIEGLGDFVDFLSKFSITQGVILDLNPYWITAYRLFASGLNPNEIWNRERRPCQPMITELTAIYETLVGSPYDVLDLQWNADVVNWLNSVIFGRDFGNNSPYLARVILVPPQEDLRKGYGRERDEIRDAMRKAPCPAVVELRPAAQYALSPGDRCSPGPATIGGFVRDRSTDRKYAVTCGHVVTNGNVSVRSSVIGSCTHAHAPTVMPPGGRCSRHGQVETLDVALIELSSNFVIHNAMSSVASVVCSGDPISMLGASTGAHNYLVGGTSLIYKIGGTCWKGLFEVKPPIKPSGIISSKVANLLATVPASGDSGAWCQTLAASEWCGMLVATDTLQGYALESDALVSESNTAFGMDLVLA